MNTQKNATFLRKATTLLGAIAASSLLGLPALAGGIINTGDNSGKQTQTALGSDKMQCASMVQSSLPSSTVTPDAAAPGAAQLPNQADPRTGLSGSNQAVSNQPTVNQSTSDQAMANRSSEPVAEASVIQTIAPISNNGTRNQASVYGDVLAQGGVTAGGFASQKVAASNNPDANRNANNRYSSNQRVNAANGSTMTGTTGTVTNEPMRTDAMMQSSMQSSRMTNGTAIAQCPAGTMPRPSTPAVRQVPDQPAGMQASPQPTNPQMRQFPADDNGSRAR